MMNEALKDIYSHTRLQAIEAGEQFDAGDMAKEAGFRFPVFLTRAVWQNYIVPPAGLEDQVLEGQALEDRLWQTLVTLRAYINLGGVGTDIIYFLVPYQLPVEEQLRGYEAINYAKEHNLTLAKSEDPSGPAREGLTVEEAAAVEPRLIYINRLPSENPQFEAREIQLVAVSGPTDNDDIRPALTVMLTGEEA